MQQNAMRSSEFSLKTNTIDLRSQLFKSAILETSGGGGGRDTASLKRCCNLFSSAVWNTLSESFPKARTSLQAIFRNVHLICSFIEQTAVVSFKITF